MESIGLYIEKIERISRGMSYLVFGSQLIKVKGVVQINYTVCSYILTSALLHEYLVHVGVSGRVLTLTSAQRP